MRRIGIACAVVLVLVTLGAAHAAECPRTLGTDTAFRAPWPSASTWFGTEALAVVLPQEGIWPTTSPGALIAVKLFWYSSEIQAVADAGFDNGKMLGFTASIERLDSGPDDAVISGPNWAGLGGLGDNWTILTGIDFPSAGCWKISGEFLDQSLTFVVETINHAEWGKRQQQGLEQQELAVTRE